MVQYMNTLSHLLILQSTHTMERSGSEGMVAALIIIRVTQELKSTDVFTTLIHEIPQLPTLF